MNVTSISDDSVNIPRTRRILHDATIPFAKERRIESWFSLLSTILIMFLVLSLAIVIEWWPLRIVISIIGGLCMVRGFVIFHDYMHGAILRDSKLAKIIIYIYGALLLTPPTAWRTTHNFHHAHVGKACEPSHGSIATATTDRWQKMTLVEKFLYRLERNPLTLVCGYLTVFLFSLCLKPVISNLQKHWDSLLAILLHFTVAILLYFSFGLVPTIYCYILPLWIASAVGSYLFYVQHNWEGGQYLPEDKWNYYDAAIDSSSYLKLGPLMNWFTANIGYHHVHHLNSRIPFYRLPEAMAAIPELQNPSTITLHPRDILSSLRLKLWDIHTKQMVSFKEARALKR